MILYDCCEVTVFIFKLIDCFVKEMTNFEPQVVHTCDSITLAVFSLFKNFLNFFHVACVHASNGSLVQLVVCWICRKIALNSNPLITDYILLFNVLNSSQSCFVSRQIIFCLSVGVESFNQVVPFKQWLFHSMQNAIFLLSKPQI